MLITLSVKQRLELCALIRSTCRGKKKDPKRRQGKEVLAKIKIPDDELSLYENDVPGVGIIRNALNIRKAQTAELDLLKEDARFIEGLMEDGFSNLGPDDDEWLEPLEDALAQVSKS